MTSSMPDRVGPYRVLERLGEGGMGIVYRAEQTEPVRREVALKVLKHGLDSERVVARFEAERQSLARMEHPSIATVHDAGTTETGRPYFVMELVRGVPLLEYADAQRLDLRRRVSLFARICRAVQHAHQKGVIHRDLKPSNILVTEADGQPLPKIIDFGIARATDELADATRLTRADEMVGTPAYMSPEQMAGEPDVDTRADIYALGVLLYELLTGTLPFDPAAYRGWAAYAAVHERRTPTPSERFRAWEGSTSAAERRGVDVEALSRTLRGDLDWVVMKAMDRDRDRRYETANGLALELERFLGDEPVLARPPSARYRTRKFVQRHTASVALASALLLLLVGVAVLQTIQAERITRARDQATVRQAQAEDLIGFMLGDLRSKLEPIGRLEVLDDVGDRALAYFAAVPESQLSDRELFRRTQALRQLGEVRLAEGDMPAALDAFRESLERSKDLAARDPEHGEWQVGLGASHFWVGYVHYLRNELDAALEQFVPYLEISRRLVETAPDDETYRLELAYAHSNIGSVKERQGDLEGALEAFRLNLSVAEGLDSIAPGDPARRFDVAVGHNKVAVVLQRLGRLQEAEEHFREALSIHQSLAVDAPSDVAGRRYLADAHGFLARVLQARGDEAALEHLRSNYSIDRDLVSRDPENREWQRNLAASGSRLATALVFRNDPHGLELHGNSRRIMDELVASDSTNGDWRQLAGTVALAAAEGFRRTGALDSAAAVAREALEVFTRLAEESSGAPDLRRGVAESELQLGRVLAERGNDAAAMERWRTAAAILEPLAGRSASLENLIPWAMSLLVLGEVDEARPVVEQVMTRGYRGTDLLEMAREADVMVETSGEPRSAGR